MEMRADAPPPVKPNFALALNAISWANELRESTIFI